jgi:cellobiose phosphorylase
MSSSETPAPWINVIANPDFGFQVSAEGSGYVWSENSRENQITPWPNGPVADPAGEAIYLQDLDTHRPADQGPRHPHRPSRFWLYVFRYFEIKKTCRHGQQNH